MGKTRLQDTSPQNGQYSCRRGCGMREARLLPSLLFCLLSRESTVISLLLGGCELTFPGHVIAIFQLSCSFTPQLGLIYMCFPSSHSEPGCAPGVFPGPATRLVCWALISLRVLSEACPSVGGQGLREEGGPRGAFSRNEYTQDTRDILVVGIQVLQTHRPLYGISARMDTFSK